MELYALLHNCWDLFCAAFVVTFFLCATVAVVICVSREVFAWAYRRAL